MNKPDNTTIQSWLNGELEGDALREMEAWAEENAELLEQEMGWQPLAQEIAEVLPASEEPPFADFFNERVKLHAQEAEVVEKKEAGFMQRLNWLFAPAAFACMALCFYLGATMDFSKQDSQVALQAADVYTPIAGVSSEVVESEEATLIVLDGLEAIPESIDIVAGDSSFGVSPMMLAKADREEFLF